MYVQLSMYLCKYIYIYIEREREQVAVGSGFVKSHVFMIFTYSHEFSYVYISIYPQTIAPSCVDVSVYLGCKKRKDRHKTQTYTFTLPSSLAFFARLCFCAKCVGASSYLVAQLMAEAGLFLEPVFFLLQL